jgi:hypothetical protein
MAALGEHIVSWNEAAEINDSVDSDPLVMPSSSGVPSAGSPPRAITFSFSSRKAGNDLRVNSERSEESPVRQRRHS